MLIDCGVALGPNGAAAPMDNVVLDIVNTTAGRLDVLVVTHRHWDRISGFLTARKIFERMLVDQVWLGWTEDPRDAGAAALERRRSDGLGGFSWRRAGTRSDQAMNVVRSLGKAVYHWRGGQGPVALSGVPGARVFFLAPPTLGANVAASPRAALARTRPTGCPFEERYRISFDAARDDRRFSAYFETIEGQGEATSTQDGSSGWRQIGRPAQTPSPRLHLDLLSLVNDTSLVMAIELAGPRNSSKVLLFPGDAQMASWLSWHEHRWPAHGKEVTTCSTLLENTVLYKVSHKGSVTGTPAQAGLDMMNSPELVAMIPVDETAARQKRWQMPAPSLLAAIIAKARGRVIRSDLGVSQRSENESNLSEAEWQEFKRSVVLTDLYIDYQIEIPQPTAAERERNEQNWIAANERRIYLIDKKLAGTIRPEEEAELREIEQLLDEYMSATEPTGTGLITELRESVKQTRRSSRQSPRT